MKPALILLSCFVATLSGFAVVSCIITKAKKPKQPEVLAEAKPVDPNNWAVKKFDVGWSQVHLINVDGKKYILARNNSGSALAICPATP